MGSIPVCRTIHSIEIMNIIVISPKASEDSAKRLAKELGADYANPYKTLNTDFTEYEVVINYGFSQRFKVNRHVELINSFESVGWCIDKFQTLTTLLLSKLPVPEFSKRIIDTWHTVVCHTKFEGRKNEGIEYWFRNEQKKVPAAYLYTNYYHHRGEYRVVVLKGKIVGRYRKVLDNEGMWSLELRDKRGFEDMDAACIKAARALRMDYVGFDVLAQKKDDFVIIEANSGPILTDESVEAFKELIGV